MVRLVGTVFELEDLMLRGIDTGFDISQNNPVLRLCEKLLRAHLATIPTTQK